MCSPSDGFELCPWPISSGRIMKYFVISSTAAGREQHVGKHRIHQRMRAAARPMQQQNRIVHMPRRVAMRSPQRDVVQPEFRQSLARAKTKILQDHRAIHRRPLARRWRGLAQRSNAREKQAMRSEMRSAQTMENLQK